jgi:hypothetical protein
MTWYMGLCNYIKYQYSIQIRYISGVSFWVPRPPRCPASIFTHSNSGNFAEVKSEQEI